MKASLRLGGGVVATLTSSALAASCGGSGSGEVDVATTDGTADGTMGTSAATNNEGTTRADGESSSETGRPPPEDPSCVASADWTRDPGNPVVGTSASIINVSDPSVIYDDGTFKMWVGCVGDGSGAAFVCYSELAPGAAQWTPPQIVFSPSDNGWDSLTVEVPSVIKDGDAYRLWYGGIRDVPEGDPDFLRVRTGYATSPDGLDWTRLPAQESPHGEAGLVLIEGANPAGDAGVVSDAHVAERDGTYFIYYNAFGDDEMLHINLARSENGIEWTRQDPNPVLSPDTPWEDDGPEGQGILADVSHPTVRWDGTHFLMWYGSFDATPNETYTGIGFAHSSDGVTWIKSPTNPIHVADTTLPFEAFGLSTGPSVLEVDGVQHLFYAGTDEAGARIINHATCG